jgi:hypothetical protein
MKTTRFVLAFAIAAVLIYSAACVVVEVRHVVKERRAQIEQQQEVYRWEDAVMPVWSCRV